MANPKAITPEFRVSFPHLFEAYAFKPGDVEKFSMTMLFPKEVDITALKELAQAAVIYKWPDADKRPEVIRSPFRDGNKKDYDGYKDHIFVTCNSKTQPGIINQKKQEITSDAELYAGCYARATVVAYAYSYLGNSGVSFGLNNIQKLRDGEPFSGKGKAEDDFGVVDTGEEITDFDTNEAKVEAKVEEVPSFF